MTARVSMLLKSRASLTFFRACFLPGRAKELSAPRYLWSALSELVEEKKAKSRNPKHTPKFPNFLIFTAVSLGIYLLRDVTFQKPVLYRVRQKELPDLGGA